MFLFYIFFPLLTMTTKKELLLNKIKLVKKNCEFNINNFIDLFLKDGLFEPVLSTDSGFW